MKYFISIYRTDVRTAHCTAKQKEPNEERQRAIAMNVYYNYRLIVVVV